MDLSAFYALRDRLRAGTVAGAALAAEDFRLRRALEGLAPLEGAAPVFKRLGELTRAFLAPDCPDRPGALLEALSLADAIAVTQGAVSVAGEVEPLALHSRGRAVTSAPYSLLSPLLEALTTSGGGRYSYVVETHDSRPELFSDYRVREALVAALGASYGELAQRAEEWLAQEGADILPLLKEGFDPKGKKEMVRRVRVMEKVAGGEANDFYLEQLPQAEKEVRVALIYALRHDPANAETLVELCKTERGKNRDAAHYALAGLDAPAAREYWEALAAKKPVQAAGYMVGSDTEQAGGIVADALDKWLAPYEADPEAPIDVEGSKTLQTLLDALPGKWGPAIQGIYRRMALLGTGLDFKNVEGMPGKRPTALRLTVGPGVPANLTFSFSEAIPRVLTDALCCHPTPQLAALAQELEGLYGGRFGAPALAGALLYRPAEEVWAMVKPVLAPGVLPFGRKERKKGMAALKEVFSRVTWDEGEGRPVLSTRYREPVTDLTRVVSAPLYEPLDGRIYEALGKRVEEFDTVLVSLLPTVRNGAALERIGDVLYRRALTPGMDPADLKSCLMGMRQCGWTRCEGITVQYCRERTVNYWDLQSFLNQLPGDDAGRLAEARRVYDLARAGGIRFMGNSPERSGALFMEWLQKYMDDLSGSVNA